MRLTDLGPDVLDCRSMGHAWAHLTDAEHQYRGGQVTSFARIEECGRCGTTRRRVVDLRAGEITGRSTRYAPGYLLTGQPRVSRFDALTTLYGRTSPHP